MSDNEFDKAKAFLAISVKIGSIAVFSLIACGAGWWLDSVLEKSHANCYDAYHWTGIVVAYFGLNIMGGIARRIYLNYKAAVSDDKEHRDNPS